MLHRLSFIIRQGFFYPTF